MQSHIILLNSPPGCGKDTIAKTLNWMDGSEIMEFKKPMFKIASAIVGLAVEEFLKLYSDRTKKENPCEEFLGMSGRQLLIDISESFCKPRFGEEYFGRVAANGMNFDHFSNYGYVFSDSGFLSEVFPLARKFGKESITIVQFTGQGVVDFGNDSRNWVDGTPHGIRTIRMPISNDNMTPMQYTELVIQEVKNR